MAISGPSGEQCLKDCVKARSCHSTVYDSSNSMCYFYSDSLAYNVSSNSTNTLHYTEDICADSAQVLNCNLVCKLAGLLRSPTYAFKFSLLWHIMYKYHSCYFMVMTSSNIYNIYHLSIFRIDLLTALLRPCSLYKVDL